MSEVSVPTGVPVSGSLSTSSLAASSPTSLSSGYIPYLAPTEVLRSVRALQELLFRLFPSEIRPASPDFDILEFLDKVFELLRSTGDVPTLLWIDSRFTPAFASVYRHLARAGFVRFLVCVVDSTKLSADKIRERICTSRRAPMNPSLTFLLDSSSSFDCCDWLLSIILGHSSKRLSSRTHASRLGPSTCLCSLCRTGPSRRDTLACGRPPTHAGGTLLCSEW